MTITFTKSPELILLALISLGVWFPWSRVPAAYVAIAITVALLFFHC